jgi:hypothetical protein
MIREASIKFGHPLSEIDGGKRIHDWIDKPVSVLGVNHRVERHGIDSLPIVVKLFGGIYGDELAKNIFLDHLVADVRGNARVHNSLPKKSVITLTPQQKRDNYDRNISELSKTSSTTGADRIPIEVEKFRLEKEQLILDISNKSKPDKIENTQISSIEKKKVYDDKIEALRGKR